MILKTLIFIASSGIVIDTTSNGGKVVKIDGRKRVIIENVDPIVNGGEFPAKRIVGEEVLISACIFADGHDELQAVVMYKAESERAWREVYMVGSTNDRWEAQFVIEVFCDYVFKVVGWIDTFSTWKSDLTKKIKAGQDISLDLREGCQIIHTTSEKADAGVRKKLKSIISSIEKAPDQANAATIAASEECALLMRRYTDRTLRTESSPYRIIVDRPRALYSSWYELFPRSCTKDPTKHGTLSECKKRLESIAEMGFHIVYFPPIHPIGKINRKGKNNNVTANANEPGSPWAIGSDEGGHKSIHPSLGTFEDFERLIKKAQQLGLEIALDCAFQCAPDHPYITEYPQWFKTLPDGTIKHAENPPKKYEDIVPFDFECDDWKALWNELKSIVDFWITRGVRIFRVDNPHTKTFAFWQWLIGEIRNKHKDVLFLAEAFTRPAVMNRLAKIGFSQSYTYFTWRNTKWEITTYLNQLTTTDLRNFYRPNFWPNTPDILPEFLQYGGRPAFVLRFILAATLCSNYGIYGPAYELCVREALHEKEEYADSEKYEIKKWDWNNSESLRELITRVNTIREENPALQTMWNTRFFETDNDFLLFYVKTTPDLSNVVFVIANLDPFHTQSGWIQVPFDQLAIPENQTYLVHDLISHDKYVWYGERNYVELNPHILPVHIFNVSRKLKRENDFDYYF